MKKFLFSLILLITASHVYAHDIPESELSGSSSANTWITIAIISLALFIFAGIYIARRNKSGDE